MVIFIVLAFLFFISFICGQSAPGACTGNILVIMSSSDTLVLTNGVEIPVGFYLDEFAVPAAYLINAGFNLHFANPSGNIPVMDPGSNSSSFFASPALYLSALELVAQMSENSNMLSPYPFSSILNDLSQYDAVFVPGGHPPMIDLWYNADLGNILLHFQGEGKPTGMICHGPMAAVSTAFARNTSQMAYAGYNITVFSTWGEMVNEKRWGGLLPYYPEDKLRSYGAVLSEVEVNGSTIPHVVHYKELVTGENPMSAPWFGAKLVDFVESYCNASPDYFSAIDI